MFNTIVAHITFVAGCLSIAVVIWNATQRCIAVCCGSEVPNTGERCGTTPSRAVSNSKIDRTVKNKIVRDEKKTTTNGVCSYLLLAIETVDDNGVHGGNVSPVPLGQ